MHKHNGDGVLMIDRKFKAATNVLLEFLDSRPDAASGLDAAARDSAIVIRALLAEVERLETVAKLSKKPA